MAKKSSRRKFSFGKNALPIAAVVVVAGASIAYASFTQLLNVSGTGTTSGNWDVRIESIAVNGTPVGATDTATFPKLTDTSHAAFSLDLAYPGATESYLVTVKNHGTIPAYLNTITTTPGGTATGITYDVDQAGSLTPESSSGDPATATHLDEAGHAGGTDTKTFIVTITWPSTDTADNTQGLTATLNVDLNWNQYTP